MDRNAILSQEVIQGQIRIQAFEDIQIIDLFDQHVARSPFIAVLVDWREFQGIVFPTHASGVELVCGVS